MATTNWKDIAELIGIAAIVASLIFVGLQMKPAHEIALAEIYQSRTATVVEWNNDMASNELANSAVIKILDGRVDQVLPEEYWAARWKAGGEWRLIDNSHYQYSLGFMTEEHWRGVRELIKALIQRPIYRDYLEGMRGSMRDSFRAEIEDIEREMELAPASRIPTQD